MVLSYSAIVQSGAFFYSGMYLGILVVIFLYSTGIVTFPGIAVFLIEIAVLIAASFAVAHYWESKRDGYFSGGFITSLLIGPIFPLLIGFAFDRVDILGASGRNTSVLSDLMLAAVKEKPSIIENLVAGGAKVMKKTPTKRTALMIAAESNKYPQVCQILIQAGININDKDKNGMTALMYAARNNDKKEVCELLINSGSNVNAQDNNGTTPLMHAAYINPSPEIISLLLKAGANPKILDKEGKSVFDYAYQLPNQVFLDSENYQKLRRVTIVTPKA